jgi:hypothetical protein
MKPPSQLRPVDGAAFLVLISIVIALQIHGGAYQSEIGGHPDEPAHYVTGLLIRDYIANGFPKSPLAYANEYYDHYPKVALGNWPPLFYVVQAIWTLIFSVSTTSILVLMAVITAALATTLFQILREQFDLVSASWGALLLVLAPVVLTQSMMVMSDITLALFSLLAVKFFGAYLDCRTMTSAILFGLSATAAVMTKGTGLALVLVPPLAIVLTRKWYVLRHAGLWLSALIVAVGAGPWTWAFRDVSRASWNSPSLELESVTWASVYYPEEILAALGIGAVAFAGLGAIIKLGSRAERESSAGIWSAAAAFIIILPCLLIVTPAGAEARYLLPILAPLVMFSVAGVNAAARSLLRGAGWAPAAAGALMVLLAAWSAAGVPSKSAAGYRNIAIPLASGALDKSGALLIVSDSVGEGQFIAELAMREIRPGHVIRRSSKILASRTWSGRDYQSKASTPEDFRRILAEEGIGLVIVDRTIPEPLPHHLLAQKAINTDTSHFKLLGRWDARRAGIDFPSGVELYAYTR